MSVQVEESTRSRLLKAERELGAAVLEREDAIRSLLLALLTRNHLLLLGPPGTAKSMLVDLAQAVLVDSERFSMLLTRTSTPDELFGMWDVSKIAAGKVERLDAGGTMRSAHIAFLDEIFKSNSTTLNALLGALNERKFRNGTAGECQLPLISCVGASNEYAQSDDLGALCDRFLLRHWIVPVQEEGNWIDLLTGGARPPITTTITLAELEKAQGQVAAVQIPPDLGVTLLKIRSAMGRKGLTASDRRWRQSMGAARAQAWLGDRNVVDKADLLCLKNILWDNHEEAQLITKVLLEVCAPRLKELVDVMDLAHQQLRLLRDYRHSESVTKKEIREAKQKFSELKGKAATLIPDAGPAGQDQARRLAVFEGEAAKLHLSLEWAR